MMKIFLFVMLLFLIWLILFLATKENKDTIYFLDYTHTDILKGYAILMILFGHVGQYLGINGIEYPAGIGVALFLIISGYGISVSSHKHGLKNYWIKRIKRVWFPYAISNGVFLIIAGRAITWKELLLNFTLLNPKYIFGWYLRYIFVCYIIFFVAWKFTCNKYIRWGIVICSFIIWFIVRSTVMIDSTPFLQARQMLAFPIGILLGELSKRGMELFKRWGGDFSNYIYNSWNRYLQLFTYWNYYN